MSTDFLQNLSRKERTKYRVLIVITEGKPNKGMLITDWFKMQHKKQWAKSNQKNRPRRKSPEIYFLFGNKTTKKDTESRNWLRCLKIDSEKEKKMANLKILTSIIKSKGQTYSYSEKSTERHAQQGIVMETFLYRNNTDRQQAFVDIKHWSRICLSINEVVLSIKQSRFDLTGAFMNK